MTTSAPISFASADNGEELARAELYGLLAQLWLAPPDADLLDRLRSAVTEPPGEPGLLQPAWQALVGALRATTLAEATAEFDALFQGVGRPEVFVYGSYHLAGALNEQPLARLRADLDTLGLARDTTRGETEDHIAFVFEVMRWLIAGDDVAVCNLGQQQRFFRAHVQPWAETLCDVVQAHPRARLYAELAGFTRAFVQVETQGFDLLET